MKIIKLIIVFAVLVLGLFMLSQWKNMFSQVGPEDPDDYVDVNQKCTEIRKAWAKEANWNQELFRRQLADINQKNKLNRFESNEDFETVKNTLRESATNRLDSSIFLVFHSSTCDNALVRKNYAGVDTLVTVFSMAQDSRIIKIKQTKAVYDKITAFVKSPHTISAHYDSSENTWHSFDALSRAVIQTAQNYRGNEIYKEHLSNVTRFISGLSDSHIRSVVNRQENSFYSSLSYQIISYYKNASITETNLARFNNAYDKYSRETNLYTSSIAQELRSFRKKYKAEMVK